MSNAAQANSAGPIRPIVLIVDDEPGVREALSAQLAPRLEPMFRVETATSAEDALAAFGSASGDGDPLALVISDERMPGRTGVELLIDMKRDPAHRHGGRIILTAYAGLASAQRAINEAEVDRYYPKPWDTERDLIPAIREVLTRFVRESGLDRHLVAAVADFASRREDILGTRRAWWEHVELMGFDPEEAGIVVPEFEKPADATGVHILVSEARGAAVEVAASARIAPSGPDYWELGALVLRPEHARDEVEVLLVRTAALEARSRGAQVLCAEVFPARMPLYATLGFTPEADSVSRTGIETVTMELPLAADEAFAGPHHAFARRFEREKRLCACAQTACPSHDYAGERRSYCCPLDVAEGRVPAGFPLDPS